MTSQYENTIDKARFGEQVQSALRQGFATTPHQSPLENRAYVDRIRVHVVRAVYAIWNLEGHEADLGAIYNRVRDSLPEDPQFSREWALPSKRTVDRRDNEAADSRFAPITPIFAVKASLYSPNPAVFG